MKKFTAIILSALMAMMAFSFAGCSQNGGNENSENTAAQSANEDLEYVKSKGTLIVGVTDFEPMDYIDESGNWVGFDAELATAFAESLGLEVQFSEIDWDNKVVEINNKSIDCVWNGMTLVDEVTSAMSCSEPYCNNAQTVIVKKSDADKYSTLEACKGLNVAVEAGSAGEEVATECGLNCTPVKSQATALMEVKSGTCDATVIDKLMAAAMVGEGTSYEDLTYTVDLNSEEYGVGFRKGSGLTEELNKFFEKAKEDGTMQELAEKYNVQAALIK